jgi:hypothetical protein
MARLQLHDALMNEESHPRCSFAWRLHAREACFLVASRIGHVAQARKSLDYLMPYSQLQSVLLSANMDPVHQWGMLILLIFGQIIIGITEDEHDKLFSWEL